MLFYFGLYYIYVYDLGLAVRVIVPYLIFLNFSNPIVEVNAVGPHFRQPWVLTRKIWQ
jgi:hypothetical protein